MPLLSPLEEIKTKGSHAGPVGTSEVAACVTVSSSPSTCRRLRAFQNAEWMELLGLSKLAWTDSPSSRNRQAHISGKFWSSSW